MTAAASSPRPSTVLIADDHPLVAHGIRRVLAVADDEFRILATCHSGQEVLAAARREHPDLVVLDLRLGDVDGADVCRALGHDAPGAKVIVLTAFSDTPHLRRCLEAGAAGVLLKGSLDLDLVEALRDVRDGRMVVDAGVARALEAASGLLAPGAGVPPLRPREVEVLRLMAAGMTSRDIAGELDLSINTIRTYTQALMAKLGAHTRVQAVVTAQRLQVL